MDGGKEKQDKQATNLKQKKKKAQKAFENLVNTVARLTYDERMQVPDTHKAAVKAYKAIDKLRESLFVARDRCSDLFDAYQILEDLMPGVDTKKKK